MTNTDKQSAKQRQLSGLRPFKKGQSGNPKGRPPGKTLKEFAREYLATLPDEEKVKYLAELPKEIVWKMAEGNPHQDNKHEVEGNIVIEIAQEVAEKYNVTPSNTETGS